MRAGSPHDSGQSAAARKSGAVDKATEGANGAAAKPPGQSDPSNQPKGGNTTSKTGQANPPSKSKQAGASDKSKGSGGDSKQADSKPSPPARPALTDVYPYTLPAGVDASRVAGLLKRVSIAGVSDVLVVSNHQLVFLLDRDALTKAGGSASGAPKNGKTQPKGSHPQAKSGTANRNVVRPSGGGAVAGGSADASIDALEAKLNQIVTGLAGLPPTTTVLVGLPPNVKAGDLQAEALNLPGVASAIAVGDGSLLVTYDPEIKDAVEFLKNVRQPPFPDKHVESTTQRLYYVSAAGETVAAAIDNIYPDVTATFLKPDLVQLSMKYLPAGTRQDQTDTIEDAKRAIAKIDQPRPRASLDVWAIQIASEDPDRLEFVTPKIEQVTSAFNEVMTHSILEGWKVLTQTSSSLDPRFADYITQAAVATAAGANEATCCFTGTERLEALKPGAAQRYALGYQTIFDPVTPNLIDMLVSLAAQKNPSGTATKVLDAIEGQLGPEKVKGAGAEPPSCDGGCKPGNSKQASILDAHSKNMEDLLCRQKDEEIYRAWVTRVQTESGCGSKCKAEGALVIPPSLVLSCVRQELQQNLFATADEALNTSAFGQFRAAIGDFLYQYKLMVQYPDDFHAYLEPKSADTLDSTLLPVVDAFYDDLGAFQEAMENEVYKLLAAKGVSYSSSGLVSMKMIAGTQADVRSTGQNSFQMSQGASAADVATAIASIHTEPAVAASKLLALLTPTPVTATLGKQLDVTTTVHSLSGAYGMELDLNIDSAENGAPQLVKSASTPSKSDDLNSRVTTHQLQTKVRVDNLKLFQVSTARSLVARGQAPWTPVDPFFQIPVLGLLVKHPRKPQRVFTQSLIFIDALVVPTAIDLGYGTPFTRDAVAEVAGGRSLREVDSLEELTTNSTRFAIEDYHTQMMSCFASEYLDAHGSIQGCEHPPTWRPAAAAAPAEAVSSK